MMNFLAEYVRSLAVFMVVACVCRIILPEGKFSNAVGFVTGIMLILIVLKPVNTLLSADWKSCIKNAFSFDTYSTGSYEKSGENAIIGYFEKECENMLTQELDAKTVSVRAADDGEGVYIAQVYIETTGAADKAKRRTSQLCGIDENKITVLVIDGG